MVGLRWWTVTDQTGKEVFFFEHYNFEVKQDLKFGRIFWIAQICSTLFWGAQVFFDLIRLQLFWTCLTLIATLLSGLNTYLYYKCNKDHEKTLKGMAVSGYLLSKFVN